MPTAVTTLWPDAEVLDGLFRGRALAAFVEQASKAGSWPGSENVRRQA